MFYSVDRFEEDYAVLQDDHGESMDILRCILPENVCQGDVLVQRNGRWNVDEDETSRRKELVRRLQEKLKKR